MPGRKSDHQQVNKSTEGLRRGENGGSRSSSSKSSQNADRTVAHSSNHKHASAKRAKGSTNGTQEEEMVDLSDEENGVLAIRDAAPSEDGHTDEDAESFLTAEKQDPRERRQLRHKYRQLGDELQKNQHDLINPQSRELEQKLTEVNDLFGGVKMTREAAMDAQVVAVISNLARQKAQQLHTEFLVFQPTEFADKMVSYMCGTQLSENPNQRREITGEDWERLGKVVQPYFRRSPALHFMFGSFEREKPVKKEVKSQRAKEKDSANDKQTVPTQLKSISETEKNEATTEEVDRVFRILQQYYKSWDRQPICYFEFVVNPHSFGQTIENIFYASFLVRDNLARVFLDDDRLPVIEPIENAGSEEEPSQHAARHQVIISLTVKDWEEVIKTFEIKAPLIPTRKPQSNGKPKAAGSKKGSKDDGDSSQGSSSSQDDGSKKKRPKK